MSIQKDSTSLTFAVAFQRHPVARSRVQGQTGSLAVVLSASVPVGSVLGSSSGPETRT